MYRLIISAALLASLSVFVHGGIPKEQVIAYVEECRKQNNLELAEIEESVKNKKLPESEPGKCFLQCVLEKSGVIQGGKLNAYRAKTINALEYHQTPDLMKKANQVIDKCKMEAKNSENKCGFGMELTKCAMKYAEELGMPEPPFLNLLRT